jgi:hypothetical protein
LGAFALSGLDDEVNGATHDVYRRRECAKAHVPPPEHLGDVGRGGAEAPRQLCAGDVVVGHPAREAVHDVDDEGLLSEDPLLDRIIVEKL